ncbi:hypothetical protein D3C87_2001160 [compost metagenome]
MRPSSRRALASSLDFEDEENFLRIVDGERVRVVIETACSVGNDGTECPPGSCPALW